MPKTMLPCPVCRLVSFFLWLILAALPAYGEDESASIATSDSISASYIAVDEFGNQTQCTISSRDTIEQLSALQNTDCRLPLSDADHDQSVILISHSPHYQIRQRLLTTRNLLMWAHTAVHLYKVWDSGNKLLWPSVCPCSGQPRPRTSTQYFFFAYYLGSLLQQGWLYISPYFFPQPDPTVANDTYRSILTTLNQYPYASHILSLALDAAALKWDCQCAGYFSDSDGHFYFNGHLWMLLLNIVIFTTDLSLDYL